MNTQEKSMLSLHYQYYFHIDIMFKAIKDIIEVKNNFVKKRIAELKNE